MRSSFKIETYFELDVLAGHVYRKSICTTSFECWSWSAVADGQGIRFLDPAITQCKQFWMNSSIPFSSCLQWILDQTISFFASLPRWPALPQWAFTNILSVKFSFFSGIYMWLPFFHRPHGLINASVGGSNFCWALLISFQTMSSTFISLGSMGWYCALTLPHVAFIDRCSRDLFFLTGQLKHFSHLVYALWWSRIATFR